jgi:hypothetical protein
MAIGSFKLDKLLILHVPFLFMVRHGSRKALLKAKLGGWFVLVATRKKKALPAIAYGFDVCEHFPEHRN